MGQRKPQKELQLWMEGPHPAGAQGDLSASPFSASGSPTCPPAPEAQESRGAGTIPTSLPGPSTLWVHIQGLRRSLHCSHHCFWQSQPQNAGRPRGSQLPVGAGRDTAPMRVLRIWVKALLLPPHTLSSPPPAVLAQPFILNLGVAHKALILTRSQLLGTRLCSQPSLSA